MTPRDYARTVAALAVILAMIPLAIACGNMPRVMAWVDEVGARVDEWRLR